MLCMKCGKNTGDAQVFCDSCLSEMQKYPVKPDIPVYIPARPSADMRTAVAKPPVRPEVLIQRLRRQIRGLSIALGCAGLALALVIGLLFHATEQAPQEDTVGKNYSTADTDARHP